MKNCSRCGLPHDDGGSICMECDHRADFEAELRKQEEEDRRIYEEYLNDPPEDWYGAWDDYDGPWDDYDEREAIIEEADIEYIRQSAWYYE